jgi:hypothetical protein
VAESNAAKAITQAAAAAAGTWFAANTGDPGTTGANEVTGTGAARGQTAWGSPSGNPTTTVGSQAVLGIPAGVTITHWSQWSAASGGTFMRGGLLPNPETYTGVGSYGLTPTLS